jgi:hypothetical protein
MAFPPRPRSARSEPNLAPGAVAPRDAVPIRPLAARTPSPRPGANDPGVEREPPRFTTEHRNGAETRSLSVSAADRIIISSTKTNEGEKRERSFFRVFGLIVVLALAIVGALSLYHVVSPFLP